ncbi:hypothetical protein U879_05830 [Defluviimonas sp. 20V17]|uniref:Uncharacterized protein n=1 Tax=Allgaiera indica TaxID=765699 RepID=A0A1H3E7T0_9RHOB|nr:hypothetical protein U879_05830 [Defluviimonas sp. 20V17]SDX74298.1 hypothetical protein SAMN05444006_12729 [Allgaiera indica]
MHHEAGSKRPGTGLTHSVWWDLPFWGQDLFSFHSQNITVAARATAERKTFRHLS